jgi:hypothetical protein
MINESELSGLIGKSAVVTNPITRRSYEGKVLAYVEDYDPPYVTIRWCDDLLEINYPAKFLSWNDEHKEQVRVQPSGGTADSRKAVAETKTIRVGIEDIDVTEQSVPDILLVLEALMKEIRANIDVENSTPIPNMGVINGLTTAHKTVDCVTYWLGK